MSDSRLSENLRQAIARLRRGIELSEGFQFAIVAVDPPSRCRAVLDEIVNGMPNRLVRHAIADEAEVVKVVAADARDGACVVLDHSNFVSEQSGDVMQRVVQRFNEHRNRLASQWATLVIGVPPWLVDVIAHAAPDLWSIRSVVIVDDEPRGSLFGWLDGSAETMRQLDWLAAPSRTVANDRIDGADIMTVAAELAHLLRGMQRSGEIAKLIGTSQSWTPPRDGLRVTPSRIIQTQYVPRDGAASMLAAIGGTSDSLARPAGPILVACGGGARGGGRRGHNAEARWRWSSNIRKALTTQWDRRAVVVPGEADAVRGSGGLDFAGEAEIDAFVRRTAADAGVEIRGVTGGPAFALLDSAWNCPGLPVVGLACLLEARVRLASATTRIAVLHHPFEELHPAEAEPAREFCVREFDLVLHGPRSGAKRPRRPSPGDRTIEAWRTPASPSSLEGAGFNLIELGDRPIVRRFIATMGTRRFEQLDETELA